MAGTTHDDPESQIGCAPSRQVDVYTDGGCDPNPGPGGWAAIIHWANQEWVLSGNDPDTTNNRMELLAAGAALAVLEGLLGCCQVDLYTDSQYVRQGITKWIDGWVSRGWRTSAKKPVKNQDLWRALHRLTQSHEVTWHWLKGHAGHPLNERADRLATEARLGGSSRFATLCSRRPHALRRGPGLPDAHHPTGDRRPAVEIYVKASRREERGGWGAVLRQNEHARSLSGNEPQATSNVMLIRGATEALGALRKPCRVILYSDASYLIHGASVWAKKWQAHGWKTTDGKPVSNRAEWEALLEAAQPHQVTWLLARGDAAPDDLSRAGELATEAAASGDER